MGTSNISGASDGTFYNEGTVLNLSAASPIPFNSANSRYLFSSWSGGATGSANPVSVTMSAPKSVTANYDTQHKLTLATNPAAVGTSNISGASDGTFYNEGTVLNLSAASPIPFNSANSRYLFSSWSGGATGSANPSSGDDERPQVGHGQLRHATQAHSGDQPGSRGHEQHLGRQRRHLLQRGHRAQPERSLADPVQLR